MPQRRSEHRDITMHVAAYVSALSLTITGVLERLEAGDTD